MSETSLNTSQTDEQGLADALASSWDELAGADSAGEASDAADAGEGGEEQTEQASEGEQTSSAEELAAEETASEPEEAASEADESSQAGETVEAPSDFTAEEKEQWSKLTPEAQALLASYSNRSQVSRTTTAKELDGLKKTFGPIGDALQPYKQQLDMLGVHPGDVVTNLMPYYVRLATGSDQEKAATIDFLARQFGVDRSAPQNTNETDEYQDPDLKAANERIAALEGKLSQFENQTKEQQTQTLQSEIQAFQEAKDEKGELKFPHFEKLRADMGLFMQAGRAKSLEDAYNMAKALDPDIQAEESKAREEAAAKAKREADAKAAADAKKAASLNKGSTKAPAKPNGALSIDDSIEEAWGELYG